MMARLYIFSLLFLFSSCSFFDKHEDTPSYIHIEKFTLTTTSAQGTNSNNIVDAWVYVNGNSLGVFELPCTIPVLEEGNAVITLYAGIKDDGISAIRKIYPFYKNYVETANLVRGAIDTISPSCEYFDPPLANIDKEDFESAGIKFVADATSSGNVTKNNTAGEVFEDSYSGKISMTSSDFLIKSYYTTNFNFPGNGATAYVELDYKNNAAFIIGMEITESSGTIHIDNTVINPSYDDNGNLIWKKIYVNLTELVNLYPNAINHRVFIKTINIDSIDGLFILFDNFKVVYGG